MTRVPCGCRAAGWGEASCTPEFLLVGLSACESAWLKSPVPRACGRWPREPARPSPRTHPRVTVTISRHFTGPVPAASVAEGGRAPNVC